jgi:hypothetical protein
MELAFINAILRSPEFHRMTPGFRLRDLLLFLVIYCCHAGKLTSVTGSVAFNLGISLVFA